MRNRLKSMDLKNGLCADFSMSCAMPKKSAELIENEWLGGAIFAIK
jgi:hypothetical protein